MQSSPFVFYTTPSRALRGKINSLLLTGIVKDNPHNFIPLITLHRVLEFSESVCHKITDGFLNSVHLLLRCLKSRDNSFIQGKKLLHAIKA